MYSPNTKTVTFVVTVNEYPDYDLGTGKQITPSGTVWLDNQKVFQHFGGTYKSMDRAHADTVEEFARRLRLAVQ